VLFEGVPAFCGLERRRRRPRDPETENQNPKFEASQATINSFFLKPIFLISNADESDKNTIDSFNFESECCRPKWRRLWQEDKF
jgi:hypothetical protein